MTTTSQNTENVQGLTLTPAELEMIQIKREKEELAKKEAEAKEALRKEKEKAEAEIRRANIIKEAEKQNQATQDFLAELNKEAKDHQYEIIEREGLEQTKTLLIGVVGQEIKIQVKEYFQRGHSYFSKSKSMGFRMYFGYENKALKNAKTVVAKVSDMISAAKRKIASEEQKATAKELATALLTQKYEGASIEPYTQYHYYGRNGAVSSRTELLKVTFANGIKINFSYGMNGEEVYVEYYGIAGGITKDNSEAVINALKNV